MENDDEEKAQTIVEQIEDLSRGTEGPMERLEGIVHPWVSFAILPNLRSRQRGNSLHV